MKLHFNFYKPDRKKLKKWVKHTVFVLMESKGSMSIQELLVEVLMCYCVFTRAGVT
jgi:hypothetical protein